MDVVARELRAGLAETRQYLLAHHEPHEYDRCYRVRVRGRDEHVCARCSGIYPGIALGIAAVLYGWFPGLQFGALVVLPAFTLVDWAVTAFGDVDGANPLRTATGLALGVGYGLGLGRVVWAGDLAVVAVGIGYAAVAGALLIAERWSAGDVVP